MATKQIRLDPELIDLILSLCKYGERPSDALRQLLGLKAAKKAAKKCTKINTINTINTKIK